MNDIWTIIGLSSLIASVVTVILGIAKDILVEKYRFKRQSQAGYIQSQIQAYSRIYFLSQTIHAGATSPELLGEIRKRIFEVNEFIKTKSSLLESKVKSEWLNIMSLLTECMEEVQKRKSGKDQSKIMEEYIEKCVEHLHLLISIIKEIMNKDLIPKYREIVGKTVPILE